VLSVNTDGSYVAAIVVDLSVPTGGDVPAAYLRLQWRRTGDETAWHVVPPVPVAIGQIAIPGVDIGEMYDLRVDAISQDGRLSDWSPTVTHTVVGDTTLPPAPENPRVSGDTFLCDYPNPPRDFLGGGFRFKAIAGNVPNWTGGFLLQAGLSSVGQCDISVLSGGVFVVMVKAVYRPGNESAESAYVVVTRGAVSVENAVTTVDLAAGDFPGSITNGTVDTGLHTLTADIDAAALWPATPGSPLWSADPDVDLWTASAKEMTYIATVTPDSADIPSTIKLQITETGAPYQVFYSIDDGATFVAWPGQIEAEDIDYQFMIVTQGGGNPGEITALQVIFDVPDEEEVLLDVAIAATTGTRLPVSADKFRFINHVAFEPVFHSGETAISFTRESDAVIVSGVVTQGPLYKARDGSFAAVAGHGNFRVHGARNMQV